MENRRLFGPDLCRAAAILMVLLANTIFFFQLQMPAVSSLAPMTGYLGLEIFLVLSGFWLARSFYPVWLSPDFGTSDAVRFVKKRLARIVPLYFLVVLANIGIAAAMNYPIGPVWKYFIFMQNFSGPIPAFFPESWGLPVIVLATVLLVALLLGCAKVVGPKHKQAAFPIAAAFLLLVFVWTKWIYDGVHFSGTMEQWEQTLRTVVIYRIDSVMVGVLFGWWSVRTPSAATKMKWALALVGWIGIAFLVVGVGYFQLGIEFHPTFWNVCYLPLTSLILGCFLPLLSDWPAGPKASNSVMFLSKAAFAIYLTHFSLVLLPMEHWLLQDAEIGNNLIFLASAYLVLTIVVGSIIHVWVEKPLRNRVSR